jgi:hypothetical protein
MVEARARAESGISNSSDLDLSDNNTCILCYNRIEFFAMGSCDHKNVCHKCCLRLRLVLGETTCSICKTELDEIVVSRNKQLTWQEFNKRWRKKAIED